jgi:hypothetical protein
MSHSCYATAQVSSFLSQLTAVPVPTLECFGSAVPAPVPDPDFFGTVFNTKKFEQNLAFLMLEAALFPRKLASNF